MSASDVHPRLNGVPRPRPAGDDAVDTRPATGSSATDASARRPAQSPWPEPWRPATGARPRTEYWDVETAGWRSPAPLPLPRLAD
jgi:hypothetical protein